MKGPFPMKCDKIAGLQLFASGPIGSDDPSELAAEAEVQAAERQADLNQRAEEAAWES
jgi:hypothetical protein